MKIIGFITLLAGLLWLPSLSVQAADEPIEGAQYVYLQPGFTVNFGDTGRLRYVRTEIAVKVKSAGDAETVKHHLPYLRHDIIMLLSAQNSETVNTPKGREKIRMLALDQLRGRLIKLEEEPIVEELYFSNFVVQN